MDTAGITEALKSITLAAGPIFDRGGESVITVKGDADYVTRVDFEVQKYMISALSSAFPDYRIMSEESENAELDKSCPTFILDPVDGTTNLIHHYRQSAVSTGLAYGGRVVAGVVWNPFSNELFYAFEGGGAYLWKERISVSSTKELKNSLVAIGTSPYEKRTTAKNFDIYRRIFENAVDIRRSGSAALDLCYTAAGRTEAFAEQNLKPWDFAAGSVILTEAGGKITDWNGKELDCSRNCDVLATNGYIGKQLKAFLY